MGAIFIHTISFIIKKTFQYCCKNWGRALCQNYSCRARQANSRPRPSHSPNARRVPLLETDPAKGLTAEQAAQRMAAGLDNHAGFADPERNRDHSG